MQLKRPFFALSSMSFAVLLGACGGGSSSSTEPTSTTISSTSSISGTVPGTLIEAFCSDGTYYKVQSTDDGSTEHPFTLELPSAVDCRLVMITNEDDENHKVISAISFDNGSSRGGLINLTTDFAMGFVNLPTTYVVNDDANGDHVLDSPIVQSITDIDGVQVREVSFDPLDEDGDDIPNYYEDDDGDGDYNGNDSDYDNSDDNDKDGIDDIYDHDDDNDGLKDEVDADDDNDGINDTDEDDHQDTVDTSVYTPVEDYTLTQGRLLASQCAQCHGTNGNSVNGWDSLAGESASELIEEMREIKAGDEDPIMQAQAHGYSDAEIQALAAWFASQTETEDSDDEDDD